MNTKPSLHLATHQDLSAREAQAPAADGLTTIVGALVVMMCFAAPLLLTLPQTMNAAASAGPTISEAAAAQPPASTPTFHERYPVQAGTDWSDSLDESGVAQWRARAGD